MGDVLGLDRVAQDDGRQPVGGGEAAFDEQLSADTVADQARRKDPLNGHRFHPKAEDRPGTDVRGPRDVGGDHWVLALVGVSASLRRSS